jgi:hypothetical protein
MSDDFRDALRELHDAARAGAEACRALNDAFKNIPPDGDGGGGEPMPSPMAA